MEYLSSRIGRLAFAGVNCLILTIYLGMVFSTGKPYTDDLARIMMNYLRWAEDGRPLADLVVYFLTFGGRIIDIAPMSQVLSIIICSLSCLIIAERSVGEVSLRVAILTSLIFTTPFFIQNASYHFDVVTISLSIFMALIPFLSMSRKLIIVCFCFFAASVASLSLYQPSISIVFTFIFVHCVTCHDLNKQKTFYALISSAAGVAFYGLIVAPSFLSGSYSSSMSKRLPMTKDGLHGFYENIKNYIDSLGMLFHGPYLYISVAGLVICLIALVFHMKCRSLEVNLMALMSLCAIASSVAMFMIYRDAATYPRVMIPAGGVMAAIFIISSNKSGFLRAFSYSSLCIIMLMNLSYWSAAHNLINDSYAHEADLSKMIRNDSYAMSNNKYVIVHGYPEKTKYSEFIIQAMPLLGAIFHPDLGWNTTRLFSQIFSPGLMSSKGSYNPSDAEVCGTVALPYNGFYTVTRRDGVLHVIFREVRC